MASNLQTDSGPSLGGLVSGIIQDAQVLMNQQLTLFKQEVREDFQKTRDAMGLLIVAGAVLVVGSTLLSLMLVHLLFWLAPDLHLWGCYLIVGGAISLVGVGMAVLGWQQLKTVNPVPEQTAKALEENLEWKTKPS
jgi:hypothetical protein